MTTGRGDSGSGRVSGLFRSGLSRGWGFATSWGPVNLVSTWMGGLPAGSRAGSSNGGLGIDLRKWSRNFPALSAYNGDMKRSRVGFSMPQTSSLPTFPSGSLSGFDSRLLNDLSSITTPQLLWIRNRSSGPVVYRDSADSPFIVLMESTVPGRNLGRYDPLTIVDQIDEVIQGELTILWNEFNQIKIICSGRADANLLMSSNKLRMAGYKAFLPISMIRNKATIPVRYICMSMRLCPSDIETTVVSPKLKPLLVSGVSRGHCVLQVAGVVMVLPLPLGRLCWIAFWGCCLWGVNCRLSHWYREISAGAQPAQWWMH